MRRTDRDNPASAGHPPRPHPWCIGNADSRSAADGLTPSRSAARCGSGPASAAPPSGRRAVRPSLAQALPLRWFAAREPRLRAAGKAEHRQPENSHCPLPQGACAPRRLRSLPAHARRSVGRRWRSSGFSPRVAVPRPLFVAVPPLAGHGAPRPSRSSQRRLGLCFPRRSSSSLRFPRLAFGSALRASLGHAFRCARIQTAPCGRSRAQRRSPAFGGGPRARCARARRLLVACAPRRRGGCGYAACCAPGLAKTNNSKSKSKDGQTLPKTCRVSHASSPAPSAHPAGFGAGHVRVLPIIPGWSDRSNSNSKNKR